MEFREESEGNAKGRQARLRRSEENSGAEFGPVLQVAETAKLSVL